MEFRCIQSYAGPCDSHNPLSSRSSELVTWQAKLARCKRLIDVDRLVASCSLLPSLRFPDIKKGMVPLGWEGQKIHSPLDRKFRFVQPLNVNCGK